MTASLGLRRTSTLLYAAVIPLSALMAYALVSKSKLALLPPGLAVLAGIGVFVFSLAPETVFLVWFGCAPFLQDSSRNSTTGHLLSQVLYTLPPILFLLWVTVARRERVRASTVDVLPALYLLFALVSLLATRVPPAPSVRGVLTTIGFAVVAYYFCAFGPVSRDLPRRICRLLLVTAVVFAVMALIEAATGWNLWHNEAWRQGQPRVVATLDNPAVLGTYLAIAVVVALVVLFWGGPRAYRRLAIFTVVLCPPALFFTYTRGPILAMLVLSAPLLLLRQSIRARSVLVLSAVALVVAIFWGSFTTSHVYQQRISDSATVQTRVIIQNWSLKLASQKPIFGWGYGSFDRVKNEATFQATALEEKLGTSSTSHDTFLTILVETGIVGLALFLAPWLLIGKQVVRAALEPGPDRWALIMCVGIVVTFAISATTFDMRFFSFAAALPWVALGIGRRLVGQPA